MSIAHHLNGIRQALDELGDSPEGRFAADIEGHLRVAEAHLRAIIKEAVPDAETKPARATRRPTG